MCTTSQILLEETNGELNGKWLEFLEEYHNIFENRKDPGVRHLLSHLNKDKFPLIPSDLDYDDKTEYFIQSPTFRCVQCGWSGTTCSQTLFK